MMVVRKKKVANPHGSHRRTKRRRNMTAKQIKHFGTKRQKAALKASRKRKVSNPVKRKVAKRSVAKRKRNPAQLITLGFMNPHKTRKRKKNSMATLTKKQKRSRAARKAARTRKANAHVPKKRRTTRRRKNSTRVVVVRSRKRRSNPGRRVTVRRRRTGITHRRRRNPELFGRSVGVAEMTKQVLAGLVGVTVTKTVPGMLPSGATSSPILATATSVVTAVVTGYLAGKVMPDIASAVLFGGLMQAGSVLLNQFLPSIGSTIGLSGLGNLIGPASFAVPQNPLRPNTVVAIAPPSGAGGTRIGVSGLGRAFKSAF
jgi:hypothetical protein